MADHVVSAKDVLAKPAWTKYEGKKRRVLIIVENLPVPFDRRVWSEATALQSHGYEVSVICPKGASALASFEIIDGIYVYRHWIPQGNTALGYLAEYAIALFGEFLLSLRIYLTRGFDVVHACNPPDLIFLIGGFFKLFGKSFVFDHHDVTPELYEAKFGHRDIFWRTLLWLERCTYAIADISIATNRSYKEVAVNRGGMKPERVFVIRSGPNLGRIREVAPEEKWKRGCRFLVAYVGVIGKQEGLDILLESVRHIRDRGHNVHFAIVGGGPELAIIRQLALDYKIDHMMTFMGRVDDQTLFSILSTADVCVNPDRPNAMNDMSTMNKIMEYMAFGKPIVQFDLREGRVSAQDASLYASKGDPIDFAEKVVELLYDPAQCRAMGQAGRNRVYEELSWQWEVPKLLAAYDSLFAKKN